MLRFAVLAGVAVATSALSARPDVAAAARALSEMKEVFFIQHGQCVANVAPDAARLMQPGLFLDAPLTEVGRQQAAAWSMQAVTWGVDHILCTPLIRSIEASCWLLQKLAHPRTCLCVPSVQLTASSPLDPAPRRPRPRSFHRTRLFPSTSYPHASKAGANGLSTARVPRLPRFSPEPKPEAPVSRSDGRP